MSFGSGRPQIRTYLDQFLRLALSELRGLLDRPGTVATLKWANGNAIALEVEPEALVMRYAAQRGDAAESVEERIALERRPRHLGGHQTYARCPQCGGRCSVLRLVGTRFRCRRCARLPYRSQSLDPDDRLARTHNRYRRQIDPAATALLDFGEIPDKPRRMHWVTYDRLQEKALAALVAREAILDEQLAGLLERMMRRTGALPGAG